MNRRSFLTALALSPIVPGVLCAKEKLLPEIGGDDNYRTVMYWDRSLTNIEIRSIFNKCPDQTLRVWKFYINGKEIQSDRAFDERGTLHFPFRGSRKGDLCTVKSPRLPYFMNKVVDLEADTIKVTLL